MLKSLQPVVLSVVIAVAVAMVVDSCVDHDLSPAVVVNCDGFKTVSYVNDIVPIINTHCAIEGDGACHNGNNGDDIDWRSLTNLQNHAEEMQRRVQLAPSDPDHMPRIGQLELEQIQLLVCWAQQGAKNN